MSTMPQVVSQAEFTHHAEAAQTPTIEAYDELQQAFDFFKAELFDGELPDCLLTLVREKNTYGYCSYKRFGRRSGEQVDELAMNPAYFASRTIRDTLSTVVHEMVHVWQAAYGKPGRGRYHNVEWGDKMEAIGLMPSNTGKPGGKRTGDQMTHYIIKGGRFDVACSKLLTKEFTLSWLDRFPVVDPVSPLTFPKVRTDPDDDEDDEVEGELEGDDDNYIEPLPPGLIEPPSGKVNKSNRVKFTCPKCLQNLWGKPTSRALCGMPDCDGQPLLVNVSGDDE